MNQQRLPREFYIGTEVVDIAQKLLGKVLCTRIDGSYCSGIIVETEAYRGPDDKASHAYNNRRTPRTEIMFGIGGTAYIYLCYGIHHLFNVVTGPEDIPHAVLVRGLEPLENVELMMSRRNIPQMSRRLTGGPGALSMALGLQTNLTGTDLITSNSPVWIEDRGIKYPKNDITKSPRVGVEYASESAKWPWRYCVKNSMWTSPAK